MLLNFALGSHNYKLDLAEIKWTGDFVHSDINGDCMEPHTDICHIISLYLSSSSQ